MSDKLTVKKQTIVAQKPTKIHKAAASKGVTIALVDDFTNSTFSIGNGFTETHGHIGSRFLEEGLPKGSQIERFNTSITDDNVNSLHEINTALDKVLVKIEHGKKYNALEMPTGDVIPFETLSKLMGTKITPQNVSMHRNALKNFFLTANSDKQYIEEKNVLRKLDKISANGIPVYVPAGNNGKDNFNIFSLANRARVVGALTRENKKAGFSGDNSLVTRWSAGMFNVKTECNAKGKCGFDYTGDGTIDTYFPEGITIIMDSGNGIMGTSYATSKAVAEDLNPKKFKHKK